MTIEEMRALLGLPLSASDAEVIAAYGQYEATLEAEEAAAAAALPPDPWQAALDALFTAPGSLSALYSPGGVALDDVRIIIGRPDQSAGFGDGRIIQATMVVEVRRSDVDQPAVGDLFTIGDDAYRVISEPLLDVEGLTWTCGAEPY